MRGIWEYHVGLHGFLSHSNCSKNHNTVVYCVKSVVTTGRQLRASAIELLRNTYSCLANSKSWCMILSWSKKLWTWLWHCFDGLLLVGGRRTFPLRWVSFGSRVIAIHPCLITSYCHFQKVFIIFHTFKSHVQLPNGPSKRPFFCPVQN